MNEYHVITRIKNDVLSSIINDLQSDVVEAKDISELSDIVAHIAYGNKKTRKYDKLAQRQAIVDDTDISIITIPLGTTTNVDININIKTITGKTYQYQCCIPFAPDDFGLRKYARQSVFAL